MALTYTFVLSIRVMKHKINLVSQGQQPGIVMIFQGLKQWQTLVLDTRHD